MTRSICQPASPNSSHLTIGATLSAALLAACGTADGTAPAAKNAPMLAVNRMLGYVPEPGKLFLVCRSVERGGRVSAGA